MVSMIDVGTKASTLRKATAVGGIALTRPAYEAIKGGTLKKGDALNVAKVAGIQAAKDASRILPMCHQIPLNTVEVSMRTFGHLDGHQSENDTMGQGVTIEATTSANAKTGVEMESLLAAQVAALTIYDMTKGLGLGSFLLPCVLMQKEGGQSGTFSRTDPSHFSGIQRRMHSDTPLSEHAYGARITYPNFRLPSLPWAPEDLQSCGISAKTIHYHYRKHHAAYVAKLNALIGCSSDETLKTKTLEELLTTNGLDQTLFNQAAQVYNHTLYWHCLRPKEWVAQGWSSAAPDDNVSRLRNMMISTWGSFEVFKNEFTSLALSHFGSGWIWLVQDRSSGSLRIHSTHDAEVPDLENFKPLLICDVWEHAYYLDTCNDRAKYMDNWWKAVNWEFVDSQVL